MRTEQEVCVTEVQAVLDGRRVDSRVLRLPVTQVFDDALGEAPAVSIRREIEDGMLNELVCGNSLPISLS